MHPALLDAMRRQAAFRAVVEGLPAPGHALVAANLPASSCSLLLAALAQQLPQRVWVAIAHSPQEADAIEADLQSLLHAGAAVLFPQRETLPYEAAEHHLEVGGLRVEAIEALLAGRSRILVTTARALQELAEIPTDLADLRLTVRAGETLRLQDLEERLAEMGFDRVPLVEAVGEYAIRGGIVDLFGFGAPDPIRIEVLGDFDNYRSNVTRTAVAGKPTERQKAFGPVWQEIREAQLRVLERYTIQSIADDVKETPLGDFHPIYQI